MLLFEQAKQVQDTLDALGWSFCFIGGIALQHWGEPRVTRDLDISLFTGFGDERRFVDHLLTLYRPRLPDAREFALAHRVLLLMTTSNVPIDIALSALSLEAGIINRAQVVEFLPGIALRICSAEDLFVLKAFADRPRDRADILGIAQRRGAELDWDVIEQRLAPLADAKEDPALLQQVRELRRTHSNG